MPADTKPSDPVLLAALAGYPDAALTHIAAGGSADLWRVTPAGQDTFAPVVLKCPRGLSTKIRAEADALAFLNAASFPSVPTLLLADREAGGLVLSWLHPDCVPLDQWLATSPAHAHIERVAEQLGALVARLHATPVTPGPVNLSADPMPWPDRLITQISDSVRRLARRAARDTTGALDLARARCLVELDILVHAIRAADLPDRPGMMMHRDLRPPNILVIPGATPALAGLVDFERAGAGDPAWDNAKLDWWCFEPYPALRAPFWRGYTALLPRADEARARIYKRFEALGLLATFAGKHPSYPAEALARLDGES
jgi:aminoglycoside phosphotransferase